jgi:hypothetical protein
MVAVAVPVLVPAVPILSVPVPVPDTVGMNCIAIGRKRPAVHVHKCQFPLL